jgi:hypothetical protein
MSSQSNFVITFAVAHVALPTVSFAAIPIALCLLVLPLLLLLVVVAAFFSFTNSSFTCCF